MNLMKNEFYTADEIAEQFHVTRHTVYAWIREGQLQATKVGRRWLVTESQLQEMIKRRSG